MGAPDRRHRGGAPRRRARPPAHDLPLEGRRPRPRRPAQTRIGASSLTLGALLKHLALVEDHYFVGKLAGEPLGAPWDTADFDSDPDWEFTSAADDSPAELYALWDAAVARARARLATALADGGLDQPVDLTWPDGRKPSLRRVLCDLLEEYGRHTGQADMIREAVDGRTGEDPPADWRP